MLSMLPQEWLTNAATQHKVSAKRRTVMSEKLLTFALAASLAITIFALFWRLSVMP